MVTLLFGPNSYAKRQRLDELVRRFKEAHGGQGIERFDGEQLEIARLPEIFQGVSLFAGHKLAIIRQASANKPLWEALEPYAAAADDMTQVVLYENQPDKRTKTFKALLTHAEAVECRELSAGELAQWLLSESGGRLDRRLAGLLVARAGTDQQHLSNELDKLLLHEATTERHIEALVSPTVEASVFELLDDVFAGRRDTIAGIIENLRLQEDPYRLFGLLISNVQVLAALVTGSRKTPQQVAADLGVHPFVASKLAPARRQTSLAQLQQTIQVLADTDAALKTTGSDPWLLLQNALLKIAAR